MDKRQVYFTFSEQKQRLDESMSEVLIQYNKFRAAKKKGKLKIHQQTKVTRLFDV